MKNEDGEDDEDENEFAENEMYKYLGFFSLIGLLKFHVLTGDHQLAIDTIKSNPIEMLYQLNEDEWFVTKEWFVTTHYYFGFALIMTKKYKEAIIRFQTALNFVERSARTEQARQIEYKNEQIKKQIDQLYHLLAVCVTLYPMQLEDGEDDEDENEFAENEMYKYLGFFSLIGLLKFHVLTGDHQLAIDTIKSNPIEMLYQLNEDEWFVTKEWFVTTHYYFGFALIMTKKYKEAIIRFQTALNFVERSARTEQARQIEYKNEQIKKQIDQLYHLLAVCVTLYPMQLEDGEDDEDENEFAENEMYKYLGFFSLIGLLKLPKLFQFRK
jgi:tetratricopeptide (TPR) repeat protein